MTFIETLLAKSKPYRTIIFGLLGLASLLTVHIYFLRFGLPTGTHYLFDAYSIAGISIEISILIGLLIFSYKISYSIAIDQFSSNKDEQLVFFFLLIAIAILFAGLLNITYLKGKSLHHIDYKYWLLFLSFPAVYLIAHFFSKKPFKPIASNIIFIFFVLVSGFTGELKASSLLNRDSVVICVGDAAMDAIPLFRTAGGWVYADAAYSKILPQKEIPVFFVSFENAIVVADNGITGVVERICGANTKFADKPLNLTPSGQSK